MVRSVEGQLDGKILAMKGTISYKTCYLIPQGNRFSVKNKLRRYSIYTFFFYKKLGEGASSKSFLILVKILVFLVPKVSYSVSNYLVIPNLNSVACFFIFKKLLISLLLFTLCNLRNENIRFCVRINFFLCNVMTSFR